jgi:hypothetical protein
MEVFSIILTAIVIVITGGVVAWAYNYSTGFSSDAAGGLSALVAAEAGDRNCILSEWSPIACPEPETLPVSTPYYQREVRTVLSPASGKGVPCGELMRQSLNICPASGTDEFLLASGTTGTTSSSTLQDCVYSDWAIDPQSCPVSITDITKPQYYLYRRSVVKEAANGGLVCNKSTENLTRQSLIQCPVNRDCVYSDWSIATQCPVDNSEQIPILEQRRILAQAIGSGVACDNSAILNSRPFTKNGVPQMCPITHCKWTETLLPCTSPDQSFKTIQRTIITAPNVPPQQVYPGSECPPLTATSSIPCPRDCVGEWRTLPTALAIYPIEPWVGKACPSADDIRDPETRPVEVWTVIRREEGGGTCPAVHGQTRYGDKCPVNCRYNQTMTALPLCAPNYGYEYGTIYTSAIDVPAANGGAACPAAQTIISPQGAICPIDCQVGPWVADVCPADNPDPGLYQTESRIITTQPSTTPAGKACPVLSRQTTVKCPVTTTFLTLRSPGSVQTKVVNFRFISWSGSPGNVGQTMSVVIGTDPGWPGQTGLGVGMTLPRTLVIPDAIRANVSNRTSFDLMSSFVGFTNNFTWNSSIGRLSWTLRFEQPGFRLIIYLACSSVTADNVPLCGEVWYGNSTTSWSYYDTISLQPI